MWGSSNEFKSYVQRNIPMCNYIRSLCFYSKSSRSAILAIFLEIRIKVCAFYVQGGSNMTGTDLCVNKPHCAAAVRP